MKKYDAEFDKIAMGYRGGLTREEYEEWKEISSHGTDRRSEDWRKRTTPEEYVKFHQSLESGSDISVRRANPDMPCKTCKFAGRMHNGRKPSSYTAGSCEKYDIKPSDVYFDAKPCSNYVAKED